MCVLILYNEPVLPVGDPDYEAEHEVLDTVELVHRNLLAGGHEVDRLGVSRDLGPLVDRLRTGQVDVVFNLYEGTSTHGATEAVVAGLLDWHGVPFTGSPFQALCLARNKHWTKQLLRGAGLPTPDFFPIESLPVPSCSLTWPVIVKPALQDASEGLDQGSVVTDQGGLNERAAYLLRRYGPPILVEEYIRGREFNVALIETPELQFLPISEIQFVSKDPSFWPIVTYDAKWRPDSHEYQATPPRCPADVSPPLAQQLRTLAGQAFHVLGCRDYARVDFRVSAAGQPYILEVNPNPDLNPTAGLANSLKCAGISHEQFTLDRVRVALARNLGLPRNVVANLKRHEAPEWERGRTS